MGVKFFALDQTWQNPIRVFPCCFSCSNCCLFKALNSWKGLHIFAEVHIFFHLEYSCINGKKNRNRNDTTVHEGTYKTCILQANSGFSSLKLCMNHTVYCLPFTAQSTYQLHLQHVPNMIGLETWIDSPRIPHTSTFSTFGNKQLQTCLSCWIYAVTSPGLRKKKHMDIWLECLDLLTAKWNQMISTGPAFYKFCLLPLGPAHFEKLIIPDFSKQQECLLQIIR